MTKNAVGRLIRSVAGAAIVWMVMTGIAGAASEADLRLKPGPERDMVQSVCAACHSVDYIMTNSVFLDRNGWNGTVTKMVNVFGAPAKPEDVPKIVDYLTRNYGK